METKARKKILYLITKSDWGGAQRYVFDLATHLDQSTFESVVATGGNGKLIDELEHSGIRVVRVDSLVRDVSLLYEVKSIYTLWRLLRKEKPAVLHINSSKAGGLGALVGRLARVPKIIFTAHGWAFNEDRPAWQKVLITFLHWFTIVLAHRTITVSRATREQIPLPFVQKKVVTIHNGRDVGVFLSRENARASLLEILPALSSHTTDFWSVTIAELHPVKRHDVTLRALSEVVRTHPNIRHIIIGAGEQYGHLTTLVSQLGIKNNVFFTGAVPDASQYLKAFDLFVLSSKSEALAYVIIEACAAGLPIIASNVGGIPEIIRTDVDGILFPPGDVARLAVSYRTLYEDALLREKLGKNATARATTFSIEKSFGETLDLYRK